MSQLFDSIPFPMKASLPNGLFTSMFCSLATHHAACDRTEPRWWDCTKCSRPLQILTPICRAHPKQFSARTWQWAFWYLCINCICVALITQENICLQQWLKCSWHFWLRKPKRSREGGGKSPSWTGMMFLLKVLPLCYCASRFRI